LRYFTYSYRMWRYYDRSVVVYSSGTLHYVMSYIRKNIRHNKNGETRVYYTEVESVRVGGKVIQRHIRSLGTDPSVPTNFSINDAQFSYLAIRLMQGDLSPSELFDMIEEMGQSVLRDSLERVGITYDFGKKTFFIYLFYQKNSKKSTTDAQSVTKDSSLNETTKG